MRLEVLCEDRLGLTHELLDILVANHIDLRGIELEARGVIYLHCPDIEFDVFRDLLAQIRLISGVSDVRRIAFMPSEKESSQLRAMLTHLPDAILSINLSGEIEQASQAAQALLGHSLFQLRQKTLMNYFADFDYEAWQAQIEQQYQQIVLFASLNYSLELIPVWIESDTGPAQLSHAVARLKPLTQIKAFHQQALHQNQTKDMVGTGADKLAGFKNLSLIQEQSVFQEFAGQSKPHLDLVMQAKKLSKLDSPLLIEGETGTGKSLLAKLCHQASSRRGEPFIVVSCASMPDDVAETELFGHAAGMFNQSSHHKGIFEQADNGCVLLDGIEEMSAHLQIKLLRFLQDGCFRRVGEEQEVHVNVRIIASTTQSATDLLSQDRFRQDLYYRLNVLSLKIPPLRDRPSDIPLLLERFVHQNAYQLDLHLPKYQSALVEMLCRYDWPGNIRQLENMVLRAMTQVVDGELKLGYFQLPRLKEAKIDMSLMIEPEADLDKMMKRYEAQILTQLYQSFPSSRKLAKRLNVSHTSIANKLREYHISK